MSGNESLIRVENLQKHYNKGAIKALDGINTEIKKGEVVVVIGPSGSGKSTFLRCLNLLEVPTGGHIYFDGVDITDIKTDINIHRQRMGMVFQHFNLFPHMTILKNLTIAPMKLQKKSREEAEGAAMELLARVEIVLRRGGKSARTFTLDGLRVDLDAHRVFLREEQVPLTPQEYSLLEVLITNRNLALSREKLLNLAWGYDYEGESRTVDAHIQRLRKKLELENRIQTVYKLGYRLSTR